MFWKVSGFSSEKKFGHQLVAAKLTFCGLGSNADWSNPDFKK
jgi:hypothetical protein